MTSMVAQDDYSDNEVFLEKLTHKEITKCLLDGQRRQTATCTYDNYDENENNNSIKIIDTCSEPDMMYESYMNTSTDLKSMSGQFKDWDIKSKDDTFLNLEKMITEQQYVRSDLDSTLDVVNFILDNAIVNEDDEQAKERDEGCAEYDSVATESTLLQTPTKTKINNLCVISNLNSDMSNFKIIEDKFSLITPLNDRHSIDKAIENIELPDVLSNSLNIAESSSDQCRHPTNPPTVYAQPDKYKSSPLEESTITNISYKTPIRNGTMQANIDLAKTIDKYEEINKFEQAQDVITNLKTVEFDKSKCCVTEQNENIYSEKHSIRIPPIIEVATTPSNKAKTTDHNFRTPKNTGAIKKKIFSPIMKSPGTINNFRHVMSPVAAYINCSPQTPLMQNVLPKTLPTAPGIQRLKNKPVEFTNKEKENIELPKYGYRSAKSTIVVKLSDAKCLPNKWGEKLNLPEVVVEKHIISGTKSKPVDIHEDSFDNLSLLPQAELSIHTEASAFPGLKY